MCGWYQSWAMIGDFRVIAVWPFYPAWRQIRKKLHLLICQHLLLFLKNVNHSMQVIFGLATNFGGLAGRTIECRFLVLVLAILEQEAPPTFFFYSQWKKTKTQIHLNLCLFLAVNISGVSLKGQYKFKPLLFIIRLFIVSKSKTPPFQIFLQCEESALTLMLLIDSQASLSSLENIQTVWYLRSHLKLPQVVRQWASRSSLGSFSNWMVYAFTLN